jgi:hypothetical protein
MCTLNAMEASKSTLPPYQPPAEDQIIVWVEDGGKPVIRGIYDELYASTARHATYREFVNIVGEQAAATAVREYRMGLGGGPTGSA